MCGDYYDGIEGDCDGESEDYGDDGFAGNDFEDTLPGEAEPLIYFIKFDFS